jgi:hypothetical protein
MGVFKRGPCKRELNETWPTCRGLTAQLDNRRGTKLPVGVSRFLRFVALLLLAVWLPVTKHCMIEAAGMLDVASHGATDSGCCVDPEPCADDNCEIVEQGLSAPSGNSVKVLAAQFVAIADFLSVPPGAEREETGVSVQWNGALEQPFEWVPAWHFEHRTALPSRAPSLRSA